MPRRFLALLPLIAACGILYRPTAVTASPDMQLEVDVRYLYGSWHWGNFKMNSVAGVAGPEVRLGLLGGRLVAGASYLTGDFAAVGAIPLDDPLYHSRKNYAVDDRRETFDAALEYRLLPELGAALVYRFARYEHEAHIVLDSDQRAYGEGRESTVAESSAWGVAARTRLPPVYGFQIAGELAWFPRVRTEASGRFAYTLSQRTNHLDERWYRRFSSVGVRGAAEVTYAFRILPATLSAGYLHERFDDDGAVRQDWLTDYLAGGTGGDLRKDHLQGVTLRAGFRF